MKIKVLIKHLLRGFKSSLIFKIVGAFTMKVPFKKSEISKEQLAVVFKEYAKKLGLIYIL